MIYQASLHGAVKPSDLINQPIKFATNGAFKAAEEQQENYSYRNKN